VLFLSYAREDRADLGRLTEALGLLGHEVWVDEALTGGQTWWDVILDRIRSAEAVIALLSQSMLRSVACLAEVDYALRLGVPVLPVALGAFDAELLPPAIGELHVQRLDGTQQSAYRFAAAVSALPAARPRAVGRVTPPPAPSSPVTALADRVRARSLSLDDQLALVVRLEEAVQQRTELRVLGVVVADFAAREDLYVRVSRRLDALRAAMEEIPASERRPTAGPGPEPVRPGEGRSASVQLLSRSHGNWSFQVGAAKLVITIGADHATILVGGEQVELTTDHGPVRRRVGFQLPGPDGLPVDASVSWLEPDGSKGMVLSVGHVKAYGEGMYT
jgi:hypothetical protein